MACECTNIQPQHVIPNDNVLKLMTVVQLRQMANAHNLDEAGNQSTGKSVWRATAKHSDLLRTLRLHRDGHAAQPLQEAPTQHHANASLDAVMQQILKDYTPTVSPEAINKMVVDEVERVRSSFTPFVIQVPGQEAQDMGRQHKNFKVLVSLLSQRINTMMVGPAGSSKTTSAVNAAKALGLPFQIVSVGPQTMQSELSGFKDATGQYRASSVRKCFEDGGVLIIDEFDAGNAGVFTYLNAIFDNREAGFPDGTANRHADFVVIACANTWGTGADMQYVGRTQLDAATLDRFVVVEWNYDENFEMDLALSHNAEAKPWVEQIWIWRKNMMTHKIRHVISPRASIRGAQLLKMGFKQKDVERMLVFKGLNKEAVDKIRQGA